MDMDEKPLPYPASAAERARLSKPDGTSVCTPFQYKVYDALLKIPAGKVTTYKHLAEYLHSSPRAVGGALRRNPFAPYIPCHRVIAHSTSKKYFIGGFSGTWGSGAKVNKKLRLLRQEGLQFDANGHLTNAAQIYDFRPASGRNKVDK